MGSKTTIEAEAPYAVEQARGALEGIGIGDDDREIKRIEVTAEFKDPDAGGGGDDRPTIEMKPGVLPLWGAGSVDMGKWSFPNDDPEAVNVDTHAHVLGVVLVENANRDAPDEAYTAGGVAQQPGCPLDKGQVTSALTNMFTQKAILMRRRSNNGYEYLPTKELEDEVTRLGNYDLDAVRGAE